MSRETKRTSKKERFLAALREGKTVKDSCLAASIGSSAVYKWRKSDQEFSDDWDKAEDEGTDVLEAEAIRRAVEGVTEPVGWYQGAPGGHVQKYSDVLLIFLLKGRRPEKYRERHQLEHSGPGGGPIEVSNLTDDQLEHIIRTGQLPPAMRSRDGAAETPPNGDDVGAVSGSADGSDSK